MNETKSDMNLSKKQNPSLALNGGLKTINHRFKLYNSMGVEEVSAAKQVIESGVLSQFLGAWHEDFYGGPKVRQFEELAAKYFGVKYAITVNSWTSGLIAAIGALGIEPGDEVIVTPWTMCASATAILHWNAIPVFADIDSKTFCLDPESVKKNITAKTKAILSVDIFGQSSDMQSLIKIARENNLKIISDSAQAPGAKYKNRFAGVFGDIGGYSLNYHKHIHTGEGGILVTNDAYLAERLKLIRNHGEAVVGPKGEQNISNILGFNFRLGEIECAIGIEQLRKLEGYVTSRQLAAERLTAGLAGLRGIQLPVVRDEASHVYYIYPMVIDTDELGTTRDLIYKALTAEGLDGLIAGYQNIHLLPMYQKRIAYGTKGFPWSASFSRQDVSYKKGICPVAEKLHDTTFLGFAMCKFNLNDKEIDSIIATFQKVWECLF